MSPQRTFLRGERTARALAVLVVVMVAAVPVGSAATPLLGASGPADAPTAQDTTDLEIDPPRSSLELEPGESDSVEITIQNDDEATAELDPAYLELDQAPEQIPEEWVSIDAPDSVESGESATATVTVSVPDDAEANRMFGLVRFTNETDADANSLPVDYAHVTLLSLEVDREPTVFVRSERYVRGQVETGETLTRTIVVENTGDEAVPIDPELEARDGHCRGSGCPQSLDDSWVSIDAPASVGPGETAEVTVTVAPPTGVDSASYDGRLTLGIDDPARPEDDDHWQRIRLRLDVWSQPDDPIEQSFAVREGDDTVTMTLTARTDERPEFDVAFVSPSGEVVEISPVSVTKRGNVDLVEDRRDGRTRYEFTYEFEPPESGEWTVRIMPYDTPRFGFEIETSRTDD